VICVPGLLYVRKALSIATSRKRGQAVEFYAMLRRMSFIQYNPGLYILSDSQEKKHSHMQPVLISINTTILNALPTSCNPITFLFYIRNEEIKGHGVIIGIGPYPICLFPLGNQ
jgi:hypothetical protein